MISICLSRNYFKSRNRLAWMSCSGIIITSSNLITIFDLLFLTNYIEEIMKIPLSYFSLECLIRNRLYLFSSSCYSNRGCFSLRYRRLFRNRCILIISTSHWSCSLKLKKWTLWLSWVICPSMERRCKN